MNVLGRFLDERRNRKIEQHLVEAMYQAASIAGYTSFENIIKTVADSSYGVLSEEFKRVYNEIKTGGSADKALERMAERNSSKILRRAIGILVSGYRTGIDLSEALREAAEDTEKVLEIDRESNASMVVEKYTMLFAGGIIVPLILGAMIFLVNGIDVGPLSELGIGAGSGKDVLNNIRLGNQLYVIIYSVMASIFVAHQENRIENSLVYLIILLPLSTILFNIAQYSGLLII